MDITRNLVQNNNGGKRYNIYVTEDMIIEAFKELEKLNIKWNSGDSLLTSDGKPSVDTKHIVLDAQMKSLFFGFSESSPHVIYYPGIFTETKQRYEDLLI